MHKLFCLGDSHVSVFLGKDQLAPLYPETQQSYIERIEVIRLEGILAYNLCEYNRTTKGREKLETELARIPKKSWILISAGEVDARVHLIKQANKQNKSFDEVSIALAKRYIGFLSTLKHDYHLLLLLPPPTSYLGEDKIDPSYPRYGSEVERNRITKTLIRALINECEINAINYIKIFEKATTANGCTKQKYLWDGIHLSTYALPYLIKQINQQTNLNLRLSGWWWCKEYLRRIKNFRIKHSFLKRINIV